MKLRNRILFMAPHAQIAAIARSAALELGLNVQVETAIIEDAVTIARNAQKSGAELVISRGATLAALKKCTDLLLVELRENNLEILRAIQEGTQHGQNIALIWYSEIPYRENFIYSLLKVKCQFYRYETRDEIERLVAQAVENGADVIVGGSHTVHTAENMGVKSVIVGCDRESIVYSLKQAQYLLEVRHQEEIKRKRVETIIENVHDGIIAIDQSGVITTFNPAAESIMGLKLSQVIGKNIRSVIPNTKLLDVVQGNNQLNQLQDVGRAVISTNRVKMKIGDEVVGAVATFQDVTKIQQMEQQIRQKLYSKGHVARYRFEDIVGQARALESARNTAARYSQTDQTILLTGESGTGKEMFAQSIHLSSRRKNGPFVAVNCAEVSASLFESELFGYDEGAFTGARKGGKAGLFSLAHRGTIFLDEISELSLQQQTVLLRTLQEKIVRPVGGDRVIPIDVRIVAASNRNLRGLVLDGKLREDLYYRLNVLAVRIPSLRERKEDIPLLVEAFVREHGAPEIDPEAVRLLAGYDWPGNVRELFNILMRLAVLHPENPVGRDDLLAAAPEIFGMLGTSAAGRAPLAGDITLYPAAHNNRERTLDDLVDQAIDRALKICDGNQSKAAKMLGVSRTFLWRRMKAVSKTATPEA